MHTIVLAISDYQPDGDLEGHCGHEFDYFTWEGNQTPGDSTKWRESLELPLRPAPARSDTDAAFVEAYGEQGLKAAPLLANVDIERLFTERPPEFILVGGSLFRREGWCLAHRCLEQNPDYSTDAMAQIRWEIERHPSLRVWVYDVHY